MNAPRYTPDAFLLSSVGITDVGVQRTQNEDALYFDDFLGVYVVCDGMGGHASGQIASDVAIRAIVHALKADDPPAPPGAEPLAHAIRAANLAVLARAMADESCHGMGTTAVGIRFDGEMLHVCHCGDSRAYLWRQGQLQLMTRDHSLRNLYEDRPDLEGTMGPATSNVIIRAVGLDAFVDIEHQVWEPQHDDVFLLCCDGLTDLVDDATIASILRGAATLDEAATVLVQTANRNGGSDNITVILVHAAQSPMYVR